MLFGTAGHLVPPTDVHHLREKGKQYDAKGKGKTRWVKKEKGKVLAYVWGEFPLCNQTARTHARKGTERFPGWTPPPPNLRLRKVAEAMRT